MPLRSPSPSDAVARLLLIDEERTRAYALAEGFCQFFAVPLTPMVVPGGRGAIEALKGNSFDIVLMDLASLGDLVIATEDAVARLVKLAEGALTVVISEASTVSAALGVMRAGAHDFVARPLDPFMLADRIGELAQRHGKARLLAADQPAPESNPFAGATENGSEAHGSGAAGAARPAILPMWQQEQRIIEEAIASCAGNVALAAAALQLSPSTIYRKRQAWAEAEDRRGVA